MSEDKGLIKISVMYPFSEGKTFDIEYYEAKHMPHGGRIAWSKPGEIHHRKRCRERGISNQQPHMAIGTFYVKDLAEYQAATAPNRDAITADFANYTNATPVIFVSEVVR